MNVLSGFLFFAAGAIAGSFLNVLVLRLGTGATVFGRSRCGVCGAQIPWQGLIPVVSFFAQRGRCISCRTRISRQYPILEFLTGALFLGLLLKLEPSVSGASVAPFLYYAVMFSLLLAIAAYDLRHLIVPDALVYPFILLALVLPFSDLSAAGRAAFLSRLAAGPLLALPFAALFFVSKGRWMGFGDAKLALGFGWLLGFPLGLSAILFGFWIGAGVSLLLIFTSRLAPRGRLSFVPERLTMKSEIPFAPFLILAALLVFFFEWDPVGFSRALFF